MGLASSELSANTQEMSESQLQSEVPEVASAAPLTSIEVSSVKLPVTLSWAWGTAGLIANISTIPNQQLHGKYLYTDTTLHLTNEDQHDDVCTILHNKHLFRKYVICSGLSYISFLHQSLDGLIPLSGSEAINDPTVTDDSKQVWIHTKILFNSLHCCYRTPYPISMSASFRRALRRGFLQKHLKLQMTKP